MNGTDPQPAADDPVISTYGTRIRSDAGLFDGQALHDFAHTKAVKFGCAAIATLIAASLGVVVFTSVKSAVEITRGSDAMAKADRELDAKRFSLAISSYTAALRERISNRDRAYAYGCRGLAYTKIKRDPEAIQDFTAALQIMPSLAFACLNRGLAFHRLGRFSEALADYDRSVSLNRNEVDAYYNRSAIYSHLGRSKDAIADMSEAIRCFPSDPRLYVDRGTLYLRDADLEAARASYESAIRLDPQNADAYWGLGIAFRRLGQPVRGLTLVSEAMRLHPESASLFFARGLIQMDLQSPEEALKDFDQAILHDPKFAMAYSNRGAVEFWLGRTDTALGYATRAIALDPTLSAPYYVGGRAYDAEGDYSDAVSEFDKAIARDSEFIWAVGWRAMAEGHGGAYDTARRDLEKATNQFPGAYEVHLLRAWFLATCPSPSFRNGPLAVIEGQLAVTLSHEDLYALDALAAAYGEVGDFERARQLEVQVLTKIPNLSPDRKRMQARLELYGQDKPYRDYP